MLTWLENTPVAIWVKESWGWPLALTLHAFGAAVVVGFSVILCLRLLGFFRTIPATSLSKLIPYIWVAVVVQFCSGVLLWMTKPARYLSDGLFDAKLAFVVSGIALTWYFQNMLKQEAAGWQASGKVSTRGMQFITITAIAWASVLVTGRLTAYLGQLYHA